MDVRGCVVLEGVGRVVSSCWFELQVWVKGIVPFCVGEFEGEVGEGID